jgi:carboxypeptidase C (cathepsin A)
MPYGPLIAALLSVLFGLLTPPWAGISAQLEPVATTHHQTTVEGRALSYTARAGHLPIRLNETGEVRGHVFFTHYALNVGPDSPPRPLTFLWNGGPGANSVLVHLVGFGPVRIRTSDTPLEVPDCDCVLEPNDGTWLEATDLVFVDPIGTGFSRPTEVEYADDFYGVMEDVAYIAEFVRLFVTRFDAWDAPLFIGGESYGTWRASGVARTLEEQGIPVAGVILISGGVPVGPLEAEEMRVAHLLTSRTASAFFHGRLEAGLQGDQEDALRQAEEWATRVYAPALARREALSHRDRRIVVEGLARYTGMDVGRIDAEALVINRQQFVEELMAEEGVELARFDTRLPTVHPSPPPGARAELVGRYLRDTLGFQWDQAYQGLEVGYRPVSDSAPRGPGARWRYNHATPGEPPPVRLTVGDGPPGGRPSWLREALEANPSIRVFVATGLYDSLNSCSLNRHVVGLLDRELQDNFTLVCYPAGHVVYEDRDVRLRMKADVSRFIRAARPRSDSSSFGSARGSVGTEASELSATPLNEAALAHPGFPVSAGTDGAFRGQNPAPEDEIVTTQHSIRLAGRGLDYTARAGRLPMREDEAGKVRAHVFFVSYSVEPEPGEGPRPLLFAWNGGPGSNAGLLHVTAMGPRRMRMDDVFATADPSEMSDLVDNEATWLPFTDLVFVDPVGTGYSRPTRAEFGPEFYDTVGDVESLAEFIRVYRTRYDASDAPLFLAGESFGSLRAASVARVLQRRGIDVSGIVFISGSPGLGSLPTHLRSALLLPSLTASSLYHGKLPPGLSADPDRAIQEARDWALATYASALRDQDDLTSDQRTPIAGELARFTGMPPDLIAASGLAVTAPMFSEQLLADEGRILGRYDARLSRPRKESEEIFDPREDASLAPLENRISGNAPTMIRYLRGDLGFESDLYYIGPFGGAWPPPTGFRGDWMSVRWNWREGPVEPLRDAMTMNPTLRILHASGRYDLTTPAGPPAHLISQLEPALRDRITVKVYVGGHSFYLDRTSRLQFMRDGSALMEASASENRTPALSPRSAQDARRGARQRPGVWRDE